MKNKRSLTFELLEERHLMSADSLFFTKDVSGGDDLLISVSGLTRGAGVVSLASQPGYTSVDTDDPGLNVGVIDAKYVSGIPTVAIGGNVVHSFDGADITNLFGTAWDPDGAPVAGVDALAIGDFGGLSDQIVIARETTPGANDVLILSTDALNPGGSVTVAGGPAPNGTAHGLVLGDFQLANAGNEALIGFTDAAAAGGNGHQLFYTTSGSSGQYYINRPISDVAAGDLTGSGNIDYVLTGLNNVGATGFGQGSRVYEANGGAGNLKSSPGLSGPHNPPRFNAVAIGNLDDDPDNEIVLVGDFVRVLDNNGSGSFDVLPALFQSSSLSGAQFVDVAIADADGDGVNEVVAVADNGLVYMYGHSVAADASSAFAAGALGVFDTGASSLLGVAALERSPGPTSVVARYVFYNNSKFDGKDSQANSSDDEAIATDKSILLPSETATFENYTSYVQGINGIMIDIEGLANPAGLSLADFEFRVGNSDDAFPWSAAPAPINDIAADIRLGAGEDGSDRVTLIWDTGAIMSEWLQVTVKANENTGLLFDDVFYIGNAIGETGNSSGDTLVTTDDVDDTISNPHGPFNQATIEDVYDYNRDGLVGAGDIVIVRDNLTGDPIGIGQLTAPLSSLTPLQILENSDGQWFRLEESGGTGWNFDHFSDAGLGISSAVDISTDGSPLHLYLSENGGGMRLYLWEEGQVVPNMPHTGVKPTVAVYGNILSGNIYSIEDNPMTLFMRMEKNLSASASTSFFSANQGINSDVDGGAGIILHPDHHQDTSAFAGDPVDHPLSGNLTVAAYGQGSGAQSNAILFQTRSGTNQVADRMMIKDGTVDIYGNLIATGSITPGSSREYKDNIQSLSPELASQLIAGLSPVSFVYNEDTTQPRYGFIAEDVPTVFGTSDQKGVDLMSIVSALTLVVQQQRTQIDQLSDLLEPYVVGLGLSSDGGPAEWNLPGFATLTSTGSGSGLAAQSSSLQSLAASLTNLLVSAASSSSPTGTVTIDSASLAAALNPSPTLALAAATAVQAQSAGSGGAAAVNSLPSVSPFQIVEDMNQWIRLQEEGGQGWTFNHTSNPAMGIDSALDISNVGSPLDWYLADTADGMQMYLWDDGHFVPDLSLTGEKPDFAIWGDILSGDIDTYSRDPISMFLRDETDLSASAATVLFSANTGINSEVDGGAGIVLHPDHHQDTEVFPGDPAVHGQSGTLQLIAYGKGSGAQANAIVFQTRSGTDQLADRMVVKDGTVTVYGNIVATGSVIPGSSSNFKQDIEQLDAERAAQLIGSLDPVSFVYTADPTQPRLGFIAEDVPQEFGTDNQKGVDAMSIVSALTLVVQQQQGEIERLTDLFHTLQTGLGIEAVGSGGSGAATVDATTLASLMTELSVGQTAAAYENYVLQAASTYLQESGAGSAAATTTSAPLAVQITSTTNSGSAAAALNSVSPFKVVETADKWLRLEESGGTGWNFDYVSNPGLGINSALSINIDGSPRDLYLADEAGGMRLYLWDDGLEVPNLPQSGGKPTLAVSGDMLLGDIITIGRQQHSMFMRTDTNLSASATTTFNSARDGIISDVDGGAGIILHPDHHQDVATYPGDPVDHDLSGSVQLVAYGQGSGSQSNSILLQSRNNGSLTDRMMIKGGTVTVYGNVVATGSIIAGSSREYKQDIQFLTAQQANDLIASLSSVSFAYKTDPAQPRLGFLAEDVPLVVGTADQKGVDPMGIVAALTLVVQQQQAQISQLMTQIPQWVATHSVGQFASTPAVADSAAGAAALDSSPFWHSADTDTGSRAAHRRTGVDLLRTLSADGNSGNSRTMSNLALASAFHDWHPHSAADDLAAHARASGCTGDSTDKDGTIDSDLFENWPAGRGSLQAQRWNWRN